MSESTSTSSRILAMRTLLTLCFSTFALCRGSSHSFAQDNSGCSSGRLEALVEHLSHEDPAARDQAELALMKHPGLTDSLLDAAASALKSDPEVATRIARIKRVLGLKKFVPFTNAIKLISSSDVGTRIGAVSGLPIPRQIDGITGLEHLGEELIKDLDNAEKLEMIRVATIDGSPLVEGALLILMRDHNENICLHALSAHLWSRFPRRVSVVAALTSHPSSEIRLAAVKGLRRIWGREAADVIVQCLNDPNSDVRTEAIQTLRVLSPKDTARIAVSAMEDRDERVRVEAISIVGELGLRQCLDQVANHFSDKHVHVRGEVLRVIGKLDDQRYYPLLHAGLHDPDPVVRQTSAEALALVGEKSAASALVRMLESDNSGDRTSALYALARLGVKEAAPKIASFLRDETTAYGAMEALSLLGAKEYAREIAAYIRHEFSSFRAKCIEVLSTLDPVGNVPALLDALKDTDLQVRMAASTALRPIKDQAIDAQLRMLMKDDKPETQAVAVITLARRGNKVDPGPWLEWLSDESPRRKLASLQVVRFLKIKEMRNQVLQLLNYKNKEVVEEALRTVLVLGAARCPEEIMEMLNSESLRFLAIQVVGKLGNDTQLNALVPLLSYPNSCVRRVTIYALERRGTEQAVEILKEAHRYESCNDLSECLEWSIQLVEASALNR